jgi:hypothetical protein
MSEKQLNYKHALLPQVLIEKKKKKRILLKEEKRPHFEQLLASSLLLTYPISIFFSFFSYFHLHDVLTFHFLSFFLLYDGVLMNIQPGK